MTNRVGFKTVKDIKLAGRRVLLRTDYNVPITDAKVVDDYRIQRSLPTIKYILEQKPEALIIVSHLGRPEGKPNPDFSLLPVVKKLSQLLDRPVGFGLDCIGKQAQSVAAKARLGSITLLENLRFHDGEEANDPVFAKAIVEATAADIFVQDGFGVVHRAHPPTPPFTIFFAPPCGRRVGERGVYFKKRGEEAPRGAVWGKIFREGGRGGNGP